MKRRSILFLCVANSARSQMAEALLRNFANDRYEVFSAGTAPKGLHPQTVATMKEIGIDVSQQKSKDVREFQDEEFDYVITVCDRAKENCPIFPGAEPIHWGFDDPAEAEPHNQARMFRDVREEIVQRIRLFLLANKS